MLPVSMEMAGSDIVEANCTIDEKYVVQMGDERFYRIIGDNNYDTLNRLIYPEDCPLFEEFIQNKASKQSVFVRCQIRNDMYRWMLVHKKAVTEKSEIHWMTELHFQDVIVLSNKFQQYFNNVKKYRAVLNIMPEKLFEYSFDTGMITIYCYVNDRSEIIEKDDLNEWQKRMLRLRFVEPQQEEAFNRLCDEMRSGIEAFSVTFQSTIMSKGGRQDTLNFRGQTLMDGSRKMLTIGLISEIGGRMSAKDILYESAATRDSATGVLNKKTVTDEIINTIKAANEKGKHAPMFLIVFDIDDFKSVNDTYGHYFGDEVIKSFATELSRAVGRRGIVGRIGGDEFISLLTDFADEVELRLMLKSVRELLKFKLAEQKPGYQFSISIGISQYDKDGSDYETLFKIADGALYIAKEKGKDRYIIYDKEKHGNLIDKNLDKSGSKNKEAMKLIDKCNLATDLVIRLIHQGKSYVPEALNELMNKMDIHGITIYEGEHMDCIYHSGSYNTKPQSAEYILDGEYQKFFDEQGMNIVNNIVKLAVDFPDVYKQCEHQDVCSFVQVMIRQPYQLSAVIEFDIFGTSRRKWSQEDISTIYMVTKAIADVGIQ